MAAKKTLEFEILANTRKATKDLAKMQTELKKLDKSIKVSRKSSGSMFDGISKSVVGLTASFGLLSVSLKAIDFANMAADGEQSADAFDRAVTDLGENSVKVFEEIKTAAQGLIPDAAIKQAATTAISLGVPLEKLAQLMEVARAKSREMGTDAKAAFNDLATGIGRGSPMILDNLGLTIKLGEANEKYAKSIGKTVAELSKEDKQLALTNAVIESGAESIERYADAALSSKEEIAKMNASLDNLKVKIGNQLLPLMVDLAEKTTAFVDSIDDEDIEKFGDSIKTLSSALIGLVSVVKTFDDIFAPDAWFGEGTGVLDLFVTGIQALDWATKRLTARFDEANGALDALTQQKTEVEGLATAVERFAGDSVSEFNALQEAISDVMDANSKQIEEWNKSDPEIYADKIKKLVSENDKLLVIYEDLVNKRPYESHAESAKEAEEGIKSLTDITKKYTESEIKEIGKLNNKRLKDTEKTLKSLERSEEKLANNIVKINKKLSQDLAKIANDRFNMNQDTQSRIAELERGSMSGDRAYYDRQMAAEKALADAKLALKAGEYEKYKSYIDQYESLVTSAAGQEIMVNDKVAVSKDETRRRAIEGLEKIQSLENAYYDKKKADAQTAHDLALKQSEIELDSIQAQLEAQKALLYVVKQLTEAITGKTVDLDSSAIDAAIEKVKAAKQNLSTLADTPAKVTVDSTSIDDSRQKVEELKTLTMNGVTLTVDADTTPADFDIEKLVTAADNEAITMDVNPEYEKAEQELDSFRNSADSEVIDIPVEVDTAPSKQKLDIFVTEMEAPTSSTHTIAVDSSDVDATTVKVGTAKIALDTLTATPAKVTVDSTDVDVSEQKVEELKTLTMNGVTLTVDADTTPADFGIEKLVTDANSEEIILDVNLEYEKAKMAIADFRKSSSNEEVEISIDADISDAENRIDTLKEPTTSVHTIDDNVPEVLSAINRLEATTYSTHIIREKIIRVRADGGLIPQRLAEGGTFTGNGKVPGYDPTDSDKVNAVLTGGEYVVKRSAVDAIGVSALNAINSFKMPKLPAFAQGGLVGAAASAISTSSSQSDLQPINLSVAGNTYAMMSDKEVADALRRNLTLTGGR